MNLVLERIYMCRQADAGWKNWAIVVSPFAFVLVIGGATVIGGLTILLEFRTFGLSRRFG